MKNNIRKIYLSLAVCAILSACQTPSTQTPDASAAEPSTMSDSASADGTVSTDYPKGSKIADQSFTTTLQPLGEVTFTSYEPDTTASPLADAVFTIEQNEALLCTLSGVYDDNIRANQCFESVDAVSFPDYNSDGYSDIIIICSYSLTAGPDVNSVYSESRLYEGSANGAFTYNSSLSDAINTSISELSIQNILSFLGSSITNSSTAASDTDNWRAAYLTYLNTQTSLDQLDGYAFIFLDDDSIPEVVEVGNCQAIGCTILNYANGEIHATPLDRLNFSYIPEKNLLCNSEGNMGYYYDIIYSIVDGSLTQIAKGIWQETGTVTYDAEGIAEGIADPEHKYEWNGTTVSKDQYQQSLESVYPLNDAVAGYGFDTLYSYDELIEELAVH